MNSLKDFSLVPVDYKSKDPRMMAYLYTKSIVNSEREFVSYNKKMSSFCYYHSLEVAEHMAKIMDFILLPSACLHWRRAKKLGEKRRVNVGRNVFYLVKEDELTLLEKQKLMNHASDFRKAAAE